MLRCWIVMLIAGMLLGGSWLGAQPSHKMTRADVDRWMSELSNWGRWGKDDQLGTLNLVTLSKRREAAALVKDGVAVSMAHEMMTEKAIDNSDPLVHTMLPTKGAFHMDNYNVSFHGMGLTHLDALCHASYQGKLYNGFSADSINAQGCMQDSVFVLREGIVTRGVLIDIARMKGVDYLEPGTPIYPEDLAEWENRTGVKVSPGDAVFVRSGRWAMRAAKGPGSSFAGLHASCARWLHDRGVAILGGDADPEVAPSQIEGVSVPIHLLTLVAMGMPLFDECDLEAVGKEAAERKRWVFLFTAGPLVVRGGTGAPINPIAVF
jgi:kynurenine formamidase